MRKIFLFLATLATTSLLAQSNVLSFFSGTYEGVSYCLPDTRVEITVNAACISRTPGEFNRYAERYLRIDNAITDADSYWEITDASVATNGKPNAEKNFTIKFSSNSACNVKLAEGGVIEGININGNDKQAHEKPAAVTRREKADATRYFTEEMLQATSTAKLAELAAKEIYTIRESKFAIIRGEADNMPHDGVSMQLILKELEEQERALTELFTGRTDTVYYSKRYLIEPETGKNIDKEILFRFSRKLGFVEKDDLAGEPVYCTLRDLKTVYIPTPEEAEKKKTPKREGVHYNIPGRASLQLSTRSRKLFDGEISVAQFGTTEMLSRDLLNKKANARILFDTATGGIISIEK